MKSTQNSKATTEMEGARFSSERKALMEKQTSEFLVTLKIDKWREHCLVTQIPWWPICSRIIGRRTIYRSRKGSMNWMRRFCPSKRDEIKLWASLVDFSPSLKRPVLESSEIV